MMVAVCEERSRRRAKCEVGGELIQRECEEEGERRREEGGGRGRSQMKMKSSWFLVSG
jgi:hypothetical protein